MIGITMMITITTKYHHYKFLICIITGLFAVLSALALRMLILRTLVSALWLFSVFLREGSLEVKLPTIWTN